MRVELTPSLAALALRGAGNFRCEHCQAALQIERGVDGFRLSCRSCDAPSITITTPLSSPVNNSPSIFQ